MFDLILENKAGDQLHFGMGTPFTISEIKGLNPPSATINTNEIALMDGAMYNSAKVQMRTINVAFAIETSAAYNRIEVYKVLKSKQWIRLYYKSDVRDVHIDGYISAIDVTHFAMKQIVTCSILCPSPFFKVAQEMVNEVSLTVSMFHFAFASTEEPELVFGYIDPTVAIEIPNDGDVDTGLIIDLYAHGAITNPKVFDYTTGRYIGLNYTMQTGDLITINTNVGEKSIILTKNGVETNIFNSLMKGSTWLQLPANGSVYTYEVGVGNAVALNVNIKYNVLYEGV